jgi:cysteine-rich repeat protein
VFSIPVTIQGASLRAEVRGNGGGCPPGAQPYLRVFDANNVLLGEDAGGACALVSPQLQSGVASLAVGTYYVQVENLDFVEVPSYLVEIAITEPSCGDGVVQVVAGEQCDDGNLIPGDGCDPVCHVEAECGDDVTHVVAGEQCDDGNVAAGDGCSPTCQFEAVLLTESEPNHQDMPDSLDGYDGAVGSISPVGDQDWYSFVVTVPGSTVTISTSDGLGGCPLGADTKISLYSGSNVYITEDDDSGADFCSLISPALDPLATNLPVGTYKIKVEDLDNDDTIDAYVLLVHVSAPGCGDSLLQMGEQCDDGNSVSGDKCSATCQFEANYTQETEPNPLPTPNSINGFDGVIASIGAVDDKDVFSFDVTVPGSSVVIEVSDGLGMCPNFDSEISLYDPMDGLIVTDDQGGISPCSRIDPLLYPEAANLPVGTYKVLVEDYNVGVIPQYVLTVKVSAPGCGDAILAGAEQCDDGNTISGDGCSATCQSEPPWEIEPNEALATATPRWPATTAWYGSIQKAGDHDWYSFDVLMGQTVAINLHAIGSAASCPFNSKIHLVNAANMQVVEDDNDGVGECSLINPMLDPAVQNLPPGTYYVWVQESGDDAAGPYQLDLTIQ